MRLVLFRHGIAIDREDPACPVEEDRFLTERGVERTAAAARGLVQLQLHPTRILSSPWRRARETAEIAARALGADPAGIELTDALLPSAPVAATVEEIVARAAVEVLAVGHAPHLDLLLAELVGIRGSGGSRLKKAGAACIEFTPAMPGAASLEWMLPPRVLRELGHR